MWIQGKGLWKSDIPISCAQTKRNVAKHYKISDIEWCCISPSLLLTSRWCLMDGWDSVIGISWPASGLWKFQAMSSKPCFCSKKWISSRISAIMLPHANSPIILRGARHDKKNPDECDVRHKIRVSNYWIVWTFELKTIFLQTLFFVKNS